MYTIVAIILAGGFGGLISTLLPTGTDVPFPSALQAPFDRAHWLVGLIAHLAINMVVGAFVAVLLWAAVDPTATDLTSKNIQPKQLATAGAIGLAGIAIAKKIQKEAEDSTDWKISYQDLQRAVDELNARVPGQRTEE